MRPWIVLLAGAVLALAFAAPAFARSNGTTLITDITVATDRVREHQWDLSKTASRSSLDLFRGDAATVTYTIGATRRGFVERAYLLGEVTVRNGGEVPTLDLAIIIHASRPSVGITFATSTVQVLQPLQPGETRSFPYSVEVPDPETTEYKVTAVITITNHSGALGFPEGPSPSATTLMQETLRDVNAQIDVDDSDGTSFIFSATTVRSTSRTFRCDEDAGSHLNTATVRQTGAVASASVDVRCHELSVSTTARPSLTRTYLWSVAKGANVDTVSLEPDGSSATIDYAIDLSSGRVDSDWRVDGDVVITNPSTVAAALDGVRVVLPAGPADVLCQAATVPPEGTLRCTYGRALSSAADTTATTTVSLRNVPSGTTAFGGTADVLFAAAAVIEVDSSVELSDTLDGVTRSFGTFRAGVPHRVTYSGQVGPYDRCGSYSFTNSADIRTSDTGRTASASVTTPVAVRCYDLALSGTAGTRLTRTYVWSIAKSASAAEVTLEPDGSSASLGYTIDLSSTSIDGAWTASGTITVRNPAPVAATLGSVRAETPAGPAAVTCPSTLVPAAGAIDCQWTTALAGGAPVTLTASAVLADDRAFSAAAYAGSAAVDFLAASITEVDRTVSVVDVAGAAVRTLGTVTAGAPARIAYETQIGPYERCGRYQATNTATFTTADTGTSGSSAVATPITVRCYDLGVSSTSSVELTRAYAWTIQKSADLPSISLVQGTTGEIGYTVTLQAAASDGARSGSGMITVANPAPVSAGLGAVTATTDSGPATVSCPSATVAARGSLICTWVAPLASTDATLVATVTLVDADAFSTGSFATSAAIDHASARVTEIDRTVSLRDTAGATTLDLGTVSANGGTKSYTLRVGPYSECGTYSFTNRVTFTAATTGATGAASVSTPITVRCADLSVSADARASFTRTYAWSISKTSERSSVDLATGASRDVGYRVVVSSVAADSGWSASGRIRIENPAISSVSLTKVSGQIPGTKVTVACPTLTIPAGSTLLCEWSATLKGGSSTTLGVTVTVATGAAVASSSYTVSVPVDLASADIRTVGGSATVTDTSSAGTATLGVMSGGERREFAYHLAVGPYSQCGSYSFRNTAQYRTMDTGRTGSASVTISVTVSCDEAPPPPPPDDEGTATSCTRTVGYWKTHETALAAGLPVRIGSLSVSSTSQAISILEWADDASNGLNKLAGQLLAAKLNIDAGAPATEIRRTVDQADGYLSAYLSSDWTSLRKGEQNKIIDLARTLDDFNNGRIGPGHCE